MTPVPPRLTHRRRLARCVLLAGLLNALDHLLSAVYSYVGGHLSDRLGTRRALALHAVIRPFGEAP